MLLSMTKTGILIDVGGYTFIISMKIQRVVFCTPSTNK